MALFDTIRTGASGASADYEIDRSLRFNSPDSANMHREGGSDGNRRTFTVSVWIKRSDRGEHSWWDFYTNDSNRTIFQLYFGYLRLFSRVSGSTQMSCNTDSNMELRDFTAWYHIVYAVDTTQGTQSNRVKMYINGEQKTVSGTLPGQNAETFVGSSNENRIGCQHDSAGNEAFFNGYMAEFNYIDGQQLTPSSFAETDAVTGEYKPIKYDGSYGTKGYYLNFSDNSSTSALGTDSSGNGNNFTSVSGFSVTSGKDSDSFADTPTNNFCVLNEANRGDDLQELTEGMTRRGGSSDKCLATFLLENGKYYFEYLAEDSNGNHSVGVSQHDTDMRSRNNSEAAAYFANGEYKIEGNSQQSGFSSYSNGDIIGVAVDTTLATPKIWFAKNNTWQGTGNPSTTGYSLTAGKKYVFNADHGSSSSSTTGTCFFGAHQGGFNYTPPTGFVAASSKNLPEPTISNGKLYQDQKIWTGNDSNRSITGYQFSPDWVWVKKRSGGTSRSHQLFDTLRGTQQTLHSDGTDGNNSNGNRLSAFNSDGFSIGTSGGDDGINANGGTFVAWAWDAGESTVTNTSGSISAQVRAKATAGFSIITYTGNGSNATIGHGLGVAPQSYIVKRTDSSGNNWRVYHHHLDYKEDPEEFHLKLNSSDEQSGQSNIWNDTKPTSSVLSIGTHSSVNSSSATYVVYCFAEVAGYSAFGSYVGNGGAGSGIDGAYIYLGFKPAWIMVKRMNGSENWCIWDNKRNEDLGNPNGRILRPDSNTDEGGNVTGSSGHAIDMLAMGFICRTGEQKINSNGSTYVYWAFAESPAKISRAG